MPCFFVHLFQYAIKWLNEKRIIYILDKNKRLFESILLVQLVVLKLGVGSFGCVGFCAWNIVDYFAFLIAILFNLLASFIYEIPYGKTSPKPINYRSIFAYGLYLGSRGLHLRLFS